MDKKCSHCKAVKNISEFTARHDRGEGVVNSWCKDCMRTLHRNRYRNNPEPYREAIRRFRNKSKIKSKADRWSVYKKPMFVSNYYEEE